MIPHCSAALSSIAALRDSARTPWPKATGLWLCKPSNNGLGQEPISAHTKTSLTRTVSQNALNCVIKPFFTSLFILSFLEIERHLQLQTTKRHR